MKFKFFLFSFFPLALFIFIYNATPQTKQISKIDAFSKLVKIPRLALGYSYMEDKRLTPKMIKLQKMDFVYAK